MDEALLQQISKSLTHLVFRNTVVEDLHAKEAVLNDETMKILNKEVNNRIYTLLKWYTSGREEDRKAVSELISFSALYGSGWDPAEMLEISDF